MMEAWNLVQAGLIEDETVLDVRCTNVLPFVTEIRPVLIATVWNTSIHEQIGRFVYTLGRYGHEVEQGETANFGRSSRPARGIRDI